MRACATQPSASSPFPPLFSHCSPAAPAAAPRAGGPLVEVVVTLPQPPLALHGAAIVQPPRGTVCFVCPLARRGAAGVRCPARHAGARRARLLALRRRARRRLGPSSRLAASPSERDPWGDRLADGDVPLSRRRDICGRPVRAGQPPAATHRRDDRLGPRRPLANAGQGLKIGIIDDGIDQKHPYFDPTGFAYPSGFPLGNTSYTTPKVIVARAFPSPSTHWKYASKPFDPVCSDHATHVAGIAAGDYDTTTDFRRQRPVLGHRADGVYRQLQGADSADARLRPRRQLAGDRAAIDQAVKDGMNVINLSLGEPEVPPTRDIVVQAIDDAAAAGSSRSSRPGTTSRPPGAARSARRRTHPPRSRSPPRPAIVGHAPGRHRRASPREARRRSRC